MRNRTVITLKGTVTKTLRTVKVEDIVYNVSAVSGTPRAYFLINAGDSSNVTGDFFTDNEDIAVELIYTDASAGKTTRTLDEGLVVFNGYAWVPESQGVEAWAKEGNDDKFPDAKQNTVTWAREGDTSPAPIGKLPITRLTQAAYNALTTKTLIRYTL